MNCLITILTIAVLITGGYLFINIIYPKNPFFEKLTLGFLVFIGVETFVWFLLNTQGIPYVLASASGVVFISTGLLLIANIVLKRFHKIKFKILSIPKYSKYQLIIYITLIVIFLSSFVKNIYWPVKDWDSLALYDFRAQIFTKTGSAQEGVELGYFFQYPFNTSLIHTFIYLNGINNPMLFYTMVYVSFCVSFYYLIRKRLGENYSLFFTFIFAVSTMFYEHSSMAYTNLLFSAYFSLAFIFLINFVTCYQYTYEDLLLSAILLSMALWTRFNEPLWIANLVVVTIFSIQRKKWQLPFIYLVPLFVVRYVWLKYVDNLLLSDLSSPTSNLYNEYFSVLLNLNLPRMLDVAKYLLNSISGSLGSLLLTFIVMQFVKNKNTLLNKYIMIFVVSNMLIIYLGTLIFSYKLPEWRDISNSVTRMTMYFIPCMIYYFALMSKCYISKNND